MSRTIFMLFIVNFMRAHFTAARSLTAQPHIIYAFCQFVLVSLNTYNIFFFGCSFSFRCPGDVLAASIDFELLDFGICFFLMLTRFVSQFAHIHTQKRRMKIAQQPTYHFHSVWNRQRGWSGSVLASDSSKWRRQHHPSTHYP